MQRTYISFLRSTILLAVLSSNIAFSGDGTGGLAGAFLRIPVNARANGMGSANTSIVQDPAATWWNPAGLSSISEIQFMGMYAAMSMDRSHNYAAVASPLPWNNSGVIGFSWLQFGVSDIDGRDFRGRQTEKFNDNEMAFSLSYAYPILSFLSVGLTGTYLHHSLSEFNANGFGLDLGLVGHFNEQLYLGINIKNIMGSLKWDTDSNLKESLPLLGRVGLGYMCPFIPLNAAIDVERIEFDDQFRFYGGAEYWIFRDIFALRTGYAYDHLNAGASFGWQTPKIDFRIDYAFINDALDEGATNQFAIALWFK